MAKRVQIQAIAVHSQAVRGVRAAVDRGAYQGRCGARQRARCEVRARAADRPRQGREADPVGENDRASRVGVRRIKADGVQLVFRDETGRAPPERAEAETMRSE